MNIDKYMQPEMCQVLMKVFNKPLESLALDFVLTEHPLEIKMIKLEKILGAKRSCCMNFRETNDNK